jgi:hypothetical protein
MCRLFALLMSWSDGHELADLRPGIDLAMRFHESCERENLRNRWPQRTGDQPVE